MFAMESAGRREKAESFVRQYSFKVAADLPENELAQLLKRNQSAEIAKENKVRDGINSDFNRWLCAERPDRFALPCHLPVASYECEELRSYLVMKLWEKKTESCFSRNERNWQRLG